MGGWGSQCSGSNPGCYLQANFDGAFPDGISIGCDLGQILHFTSAQAVTDFLTCGGQQSVLITSDTNSACTDNVFAGQLLAATLNLGFDDAIDDFGADDVNLRELVFTNPDFAGYHVDSFVAEAHQVIGGCTPGNLDFFVEGLTIINEDFVNGTEANGGLENPNCNPSTCSCGVVCPDDVELDCLGDTSPEANGMPSVTGDCCQDTDEGSCDVQISWSHHDSEVSEGCVSTFTRTFTGVITVADHIDWSANEDTVYCHQTFTLIDTTPPTVTISCPSEATVHVDGGCLADAHPDVTGHASASIEDLCDPNPTLHPLTYVDHDTSYAAGATAGCFTFIRTWSATGSDWCGLSDMASCHQTISVLDQHAPTVHTSDMTAECGPDYSAWTNADWEAYGSATATDNCADPTPSVTHVAYHDDDCYGFYVLTWSATDDCGNTGTGHQTIDIIDEHDPIISVDDVELPCVHDDTTDYGTWTEADWMALFNPSATDNCDAHVDISLGTVALIAEGCTTTYEVTWHASDDCGNSTGETVQLNIIDDAPPVVETVCPEPYDLYVDENCNAEIPLILPEWDLHDCDPNAVVDSLYYFDFDTVYTGTGDDDYPEGCFTFQRRWITFASDWCNLVGNDTCYHTFVVHDTIAPVIQADPVVYIPCVSLTMLQDTILASATDNCDSDVVLTNLSTDMVSGDCAGTYIKTYQAVDDCGNVSMTFEQIVYMTDGVPPVVTISCPDDAIVESDENCNVQTSPLFTGGASATISDNCDPNPSLSPASYVDQPMVYNGDDSDGDAQGCYTFIREWSVTGTDWCDSTSTATCQQTITVVDLLAPDVHATDMEAECGPDYASWSHDDWALLGAATASDNCDTHVSLELTGAAYNDDDCYGFYVLTWTAMDDCGNTGTGHQTINIVDNHAPTVHTTDMEAECGPNYGGWSHEEWADYGGATASDNCDDDITPTVTGVSYTVSGCFGQYELTWTATDDCGNSATGIQTITIVDNQAPSCPDADITVCCPSEVPMPMAPSFTDNCDYNPNVTLTGADTTWDAACPTQGVILRYWSAMDCSGNIAECTQTITIEDNDIPTFDYTCGYTDGEVIQICCETATEQDFLSYSCDNISWNDNCPDHVILEYTSNLDWDGGTVSGCAVSTPEAAANGETCTGFVPHALRLFNLPSGDKYFGLASSGTVTYIGDDAWSYEATFYVIDEDDGSMSPDDGFTIDVLFDSGLDWAAWSSQDFPTGYKADCSVITDEYEEWMYYLLNSGTLEGIGAYDGSSFNLSHQPMNMFYACQVGDGANNSNSNYGFSSWMLLDGTYSHYGIEMPWIGSGDVFGDLDCCASGSYTQTVTLHDCGCNTNTLEWTVVASADGCEVIAEQLGGNAEDADVSVIGGSTDPVTDKFPISVLEVAPNPTDHATQVQFISSGAVRLTMDLIQMNGTTVMNLYNGDIHPNMIYTQNLVLDDLEAGMYQIRWATNAGSMTKKVLLTN